MADNDLLPEAVLPDVYKSGPTAKTKRYLVGLVPNGPASNLTFYGINFPVFTENWEKGTEGNPLRQEGAIVELTSDQCRLIKESIKNRIVRWVNYPADHPKKGGQRMRAEIWDVRTRAFVPMKGDEPVVKYVIFREAPQDFTQNPAPAAAFEALDRAIADAEKAEAAAVVDPQDAATRAKHGALKKTGQKLGDASPDAAL